MLPAPRCVELTNLLIDLDNLLELLTGEVEAADAGGPVQADHLLDAFLLAAGASQVVEDYRHRLPVLLDTAERQIRRGPLPAARPAARAATACARALTAREHRALAAWQAELQALTGALARAVVGTTECPTPLHPAPGRGSLGKFGFLRTKAQTIRSASRVLPAGLRTEILRLPDCFRAFDQHPADCQSMAARFAQRWPAPGPPLNVVGVRTSGSYLAPLLAASLVRIGFPQVHWSTYRPGQYWRRDEHARLRGAAKTGSMALVIDDPPVTGTKIAQSADALSQLGFRPGTIVIVVALLGAEEALPDRLARHQVVTLPWEGWACHRQLEEPRLTRALGAMLQGRSVLLAEAGGTASVTAVETVVPTRLPPVTDVITRPLSRSHLRARYRVRFRDAGGTSRELEVDVKGTGLGYLGRHSLVVGNRLSGLVPPVFGYAHGLLFAQALPETARLRVDEGIADRLKIPELLADHVAERASRLTVSEDTSLRLRGRGPVWQLASYMLRGPFGTAGLLLGPAARRLSIKTLGCDQPSIVDGYTAMPNWFVARAPAGRSLVKVAFDERAFSVWDHACYDAVWDLAIAAADHALRVARSGGDPTPFDRALREAYRVRTGTAIELDRWALYQALHLRSVHQHLERLAQQGVGQLQTHQGGPPAHPRVVEAGFDEEVRAWTGACRTSQAALARLYASEVSGSGPAPMADVLRGALQGDRALSARGFLRVLPRLATRRGPHRQSGLADR